MKIKYEIIVEIFEPKEVNIEFNATLDRRFGKIANDLFLTATRQIGVKKVISCEWEKIKD